MFLYLKIVSKHRNHFGNFPAKIIHFTGVISLTFYRSYFPLRQAKGFPFMQNSMKIHIYFSHNELFKIFNNVTTCEFSICYKIILWFFYKVQISTNYEKIILKFVVLSVVLVRKDTILPVLKIITCIKKRYENIIRRQIYISSACFRILVVYYILYCINMSYYWMKYV